MIVAVRSIGESIYVTLGGLLGLEEGYGTIMKSGELVGVKDPLVGHGVVINSGVFEGVSVAVFVEEG